MLKNELEEKLEELEKKIIYFDKEEIEFKVDLIKKLFLDLNNIEQEFYKDKLNQILSNNKKEKEIENAREEEIYSGMLDYQKNEEKSLLDFDEKIKNREKIKNIEEDSLETINKNGFDIKIGKKYFICKEQDNGLFLINKKNKETFFIPFKNIISYNSFINSKYFKYMEILLLISCIFFIGIYLDGFYKLFLLILFGFIIYLRLFAGKFLILNVVFDSKTKSDKINHKTTNSFFVKYKDENFLKLISKNVKFYHKYIRLLK